MSSSSSHRTARGLPADILKRAAASSGSMIDEVPQPYQAHGDSMPHVAWPPTGGLCCRLCHASRQAGNKSSSQWPGSQGLTPDVHTAVCNDLPAGTGAAYR